MLNKHLKWYLLISMLILILISAIFLSSAKPENVFSAKQFAPPVKKQLRVLSNWSNPLKKQVLLTAFESFSKGNTDTEIVDEFINDKLFSIKLQVDFASDYAPDIVAAQPDRNIQSLISHGKIADLSSVLKEDSSWAADINKNLLEAVSIGGKIYAVPTEQSHILLYVNTDLFRRCGLSIPNNLNSLLHCITVFRSQGITPFAFSADDDKMTMYQAITASLAGSRQLLRNIETQSIDASYIKAFELMKHFREIGAFPEQYDTLELYDSYMMFLSKKAAMLVESSDFLSEIYYTSYEVNNPVSKYDFSDIDIALFPGMTNEDFRPTTSCLGDCTYLVSQSSFENKKDSVIPLLKHITSREVSTNMLLSAKTNIMNKTNTPPAPHSKLFTRRTEIIRLAQEFTLMPESVLDKYIWQTYIKENLTAVTEGEKDPRKLWEEALAAR
ncbi:MAG: carbohydrate ABC transporter substrate-binding protein [Clostridia bacterium]|nr:carbohydrate ABC transporter substrate-binding protein [Clostridia bacterium]